MNVPPSPIVAYKMPITKPMMIGGIALIYSVDL